MDAAQCVIIEEHTGAPHDSAGGHPGDMLARRDQISATQEQEASSSRN